MKTDKNPAIATIRIGLAIMLLIHSQLVIQL
jgi:hypothetical protein